MKLLDIELFDYIPMSLNGKRYFKFTPTELVQVILGTNGSGKTSLIKIIMPGTANSSLFRKTGYMKARYYYNHLTYRLEYDAASNKHKFFIEDEEKELNEGGTLSAQNQLIETTFNITPFIRTLITGEARFSNLSPQKRREIFTLMSPTSLDYGITFYSRTKEKLNETSVVLKRNKRQLVDELTKSITEDEFNDLLNTNKELKRELDLLYNEKEQLGHNTSYFQQQLDSLLSSSNYITNEILTTNLSDLIPMEDFSLDDINARVSSLKNRIEFDELKLKELNATYEEITVKVNSWNVKEDGDINSLENKLKELKDRYNQNLRKFKFNYPKDFVVNINALHELKEIFLELPFNEDKFHSVENLNKLNNDLANCLNTLSELKKREGQASFIVQSQEEKRQQPPITCPSCSHSWIDGFDTRLLESNLSALEELRGRLNTLSNNQSDLETKINQVKEFLTTFRRYLSIKNSNPEAFFLWEELDKDNLCFLYPREALALIEHVIIDIPLIEENNRLTKDIVKEESLLALMQSVDKDKYNEEKLVRDKIGEKIIHYTNNLDTNRKNYHLLTTNLNRLTKLLVTDRNKLNDLDNEITKTNELLIRSIRQDYINSYISEVQSNLALNENELKNARFHKTLLERLENDIHNLSMEENSLKRLVLEVSPTNGLIAEGLMSYINQFLDKINEIIGAVWTYPFKILPCEFSEEGEIGLTYRFPIEIGDGINKIKDIIDGSKAQKEITDLAFRIVAMTYLGFENFMLFLDEFGDGFDPTHKATAIRAVNTIIDQMNFSQIFMVSHVETSYGALKSNEVCILNDRNISYNGEYNKHIIAH